METTDLSLALVVTILTRVIRVLRPYLSLDFRAFINIIMYNRNFGWLMGFRIQSSNI